MMEGQSSGSSEGNRKETKHQYASNVLIAGDTREHTWAQDLAMAFKAVGAKPQVLPLIPERLEERWHEYRHGRLNLDPDEPIIHRLRQQVTESNPQLMIFLDPFGMSEAFFTAILKDLKKRPVMAAWFNDCRRTSWPGIQLFDHVFYSDSSMQESLTKVRQGNRDGLKYLPVAVNERRFQPLGVDVRSNKVVFAGTITSSRLKTLERLRLRGVPLVWQGPQTHNLWARWKTRRLDSDTLSRLYQEHGAVLNLPRRPKTMSGLNFKVFEVAACQNLLMTKWVPDLELQFDPYEEVVVYREWDEVPLVFRSLKYDPYRAEEIAIKARQRVMAHHTYHHRVQTILETICKSKSK